jgi:hypothetical protein
MRRSLILAIIGAATVVLAGSALAQGALPTLLGSWVKGPSKLLVRPAEIIYTAHKATVNAFRARDGRFTRLTITSSSRGKPLVSHLQLERESGNFFYVF